jgi:hypothetical protein
VSAQQRSAAQPHPSNRLLFREVNERLWALASFAPDGDSIELVCECGRADCLERLTVSLRTYDLLRRTPGYFAVVTGHAWPRDAVVEQLDLYDVIRADD